jgi:hypothetical protein
MNLLAELPTDKAMKDLQFVKSPSVRKVVETMSLWKMDLVRSLRQMRVREVMLQERIRMMETSAKADKVIMEMLKDGRDYDIVFKDDKAN